jgi:hypothetical protein
MEVIIFTSFLLRMIHTFELLPEFDILNLVCDQDLDIHEDVTLESDIVQLQETHLLVNIDLTIEDIV